MQWRIFNLVSGLWTAVSIPGVIMNLQDVGRVHEPAMKAEAKQVAEAEKEFRADLAKKGVCFHSTLLVRDHSAWCQLREEPRVIELPPQVETPLSSESPPCVLIKDWGYPQFIEAK